MIEKDDLVAAGAADVPELVALMNLAYRGGATPPGWSTEAGYITGKPHHRGSPARGTG